MLDSLQTEYREWVKETVRAASEHMTGGDYEDADETILQSQQTALQIFGTTEICLLILIDGNQYNTYTVRQKDMTLDQKRIFNILLNSKN